MKWEWLTQFRCAMLGKHVLEEQDVEHLFRLSIGDILNTRCKWCGHSLKADILNDSEYRLRWDNY